MRNLFNRSRKFLFPRNQPLSRKPGAAILFPIAAMLTSELIILAHRKLFTDFLFCRWKELGMVIEIGEDSCGLAGRDDFTPPSSGTNTVSHGERMVHSGHKSRSASQWGVLRMSLAEEVLVRFGRDEGCIVPEIWILQVRRVVKGGGDFSVDYYYDYAEGEAGCCLGGDGTAE